MRYTIHNKDSLRMVLRIQLPEHVAAQFRNRYRFDLSFAKGAQGFPVGNGWYDVYPADVFDTVFDALRCLRSALGEIKLAVLHKQEREERRRNKVRLPQVRRYVVKHERRFGRPHPVAVCRAEQAIRSDVCIKKDSLMEETRRILSSIYPQYAVQQPTHISQVQHVELDLASRVTDLRRHFGKVA